MMTKPSWPTLLRFMLTRLLGPVVFLGCGLLLIAAIGIAQRTGWIRDPVAQTTATDSEPAASIYTCPMHPQIRQSTPGRCPICGMELKPPKTSAGADLDELAVQIEPAQRRLANIETATVLLEPVEAAIESVGAIAVDESRMSTIASYIDGRIERLFADYTGVDVTRGDHLAVVYSPELYAAQVEYLEAQRTLKSMTPATLAAVQNVQQKLVASSRQRLIELGMTSQQLAELEATQKAQSRLTIYAPDGGSVMEKLVVEGQYVEAGQPIYRIADLSTVWLMLELFPEDAARIRYGQRVVAEMQSLPGEKFEGRVAFVDRTVDPRQRTVGVRVEFLNEDRRLRPGDFAKAAVYVPIGQTGTVFDADLAGRWISPMHPQILRDEPGECPICGMDLVPTSRYGFASQPVERPLSLHVPRSAVLMAGSNSVVYVETKPGRFEVRPVVLGPILRERVVILQGVEAGDQVATAGNFLIDSQMQLAGKPSLIDPARARLEPPVRNTPLQFAHIHVQTVEGEPGRLLEQLYSAYFAIQQSLRDDQQPPKEQLESLQQTAEQLGGSESLAADHRTRLKQIAGASDALQSADLAEVRQAFKPVSHAIVELAAAVRGETAQQPFAHFFCPMVQGGEGDWLQADERLRNPYWGSQMLECGELVHRFPIHGHAGDTTASPDTNPEPELPPGDDTPARKLD